MNKEKAGAPYFISSFVCFVYFVFFVFFVSFVLVYLVSLAVSLAQFLLTSRHSHI